MKLYILNGSARSDGFSSMSAELMMPVLSRKYDIVYDRAIEKKAAFCTGCDVCAETGECVFSDDMDEILVSLTQSSKVLILSSITFSSVPAQLKVIIDRCQVLFNNRSKKFSPKDAYFVFYGGAKSYPEQFAGAEAEFRHVLMHINASKKDVLCFPDSDSFGGSLPESVREKLTALAQRI